RGQRQAGPEDRPAERHRDLEGPGLREGPQVRRAGDAPHRRQGEGLREDGHNFEIDPLPLSPVPTRAARPVLAVVFVLVPLACTRPAPAPATPGPSAPFRDPTRPPEERARDLVARMT